MSTDVLLSSNSVARARLTKGDHTIHLVLSVGDEFTGGTLVRLARGATFSIEATDEAASRHSFATWASGITSGAFYAYRTVEIPRQEVLIRECSGRLAAEDMEALAHASAMAIFRLANREMIGLEGWKCEASIDPSIPSP